MPYVGIWAAMELASVAMRIVYWSFVILLFAVIFPFVLLYNFGKNSEAKTD
jgi:hypothetical protein